MLLERMRQGDTAAESNLLERLYEELYARAECAMRGQRNNHTLQPSALVHEAYLRLQAPRDERWQDRSHFLAVAARAMRHVLIDHAREKNAAKRQPLGVRVPVEVLAGSYEERAIDLQRLDKALDKLGRFDGEMARAVELRFFGGLPMPEIASSLGLSQRTLERRWQTTRAWLRAEVEQPEE